MKHLKEYEYQMSEAQGPSVSTVIEDIEFTYKGLDFMVTFQASGNVNYEQPAEEEGHGMHKIGGGWQVDDITISDLDISVSVFDRYVSIYGDSEIEEEISNFLLADKAISERIQEDLIEANANSMGEME
jgi:hypothetical protein